MRIATILKIFSLLSISVLPAYYFTASLFYSLLSGGFALALYWLFQRLSEEPSKENTELDYKQLTYSTLQKGGKHEQRTVARNEP